MSISIEALRERLTPFGQEHLLAFWDELTDEQRQTLAAQIEQIDFALMRQLQNEDDAKDDWNALAARAERPAAFTLSGAGNRFTREEARSCADDLLRNGKLGAILVAGGQGSRLGFPHPKGMFKVGPVTERSLFQMHVEQLLAIGKRYGVSVPLYLMTSPATHEETVQFFQKHDRFGLANEDLQIFCQGTMPAVDNDGRLLLEEKDRVFLSPDGHGGTLAALDRAGCLKHASERGIEELFYFQVDNPLVPLCDRDLIGYHRLSNSEMSTLVVAKQDPQEKVGNVVSVDDRLMVIEYSDLPAQHAARKDASGQPVFWAGSIAVHVFSLAFLANSVKSAKTLPFHRARKKVAHVGADGTQVVPNEINATKFERFIFDLMPHAEHAIVVEADATEVFAPLKNKSGEPKDTPETTRAAISNRAKTWLRKLGVTVPESTIVEIDPLAALESEQLGEVDLSRYAWDQPTYVRP